MVKMNQPSTSARLPARCRWFFSLTLLLLLTLGLWKWPPEGKHPSTPLPDASSAPSEATAEVPAPSSQSKPTLQPEQGSNARVDEAVPADKAAKAHAPREYRIRGSIRPWQSEWSSSAIVEACAADDYLRTERPGMQSTVDSSARRGGTSPSC
jgi:hypothetical protein